jgi:hypothetical protein
MMEKNIEDITNSEDQIQDQAHIEEVDSTQNLENLSEEEKERIEEINELLKAEKLDPTTAMNILINAVQVSYDKDHFNDLDRYLIAKSLNTFKSYADSGEDIVIKVS